MSSKSYKVVAGYDTETCNYFSDDENIAFPILHQLGTIDAVQKLSDIDSTNVEKIVNVRTCRHTADAHAWFDNLILYGEENNIVPVVMVHNLAFDMYSLSLYLNEHNVKVLAKSNTKPITFTIVDDNDNPMLVFWDTLQFFSKSLDKMGKECGYHKLVGDWDYSLIRTPETPLSQIELDYATHDIYALFAYCGYWLRANTDIDESDLGLHAVTKTGVVRLKRTNKFYNVKGKSAKWSVGKFWHYHNKKECCKTDDELFSTFACTRGGFTFCARNHASVAYDFDNCQTIVAGYDATSQHPAQMVSHVYPQNFDLATPELLEYDSKIISLIDKDDVLSNWAKPFPVAFNACFAFVNLRMKNNTVFSANGISSLAYARITDNYWQCDDDNSRATDFYNHLKKNGYKDVAINAEHCFGKLESAEYCELWLTELAFWEVCQLFDWDECIPLHGYETAQFVKPTDLSILSVMEFYGSKNIFKQAMKEYKQTNTIGKMTIDALRKYNVPYYMIQAMIDGGIDYSELDIYYHQIKADLNALFGIEATNEFKRDMELSADGIVTVGNDGIDNAPKNPKAWYQFGQRVVGWSRIAQIIVMQLSDGIANGIVNGDTDSVKFIVSKDRINELNKSLKKLSNAIDNGREKVTARVRKYYPESYIDLAGIGHYIEEFETNKFYAAWNKSYCLIEDGRYSITIAGIPSKECEHIADELSRKGRSFNDICTTLIGYNVILSSSVTNLKGRYIPMWGAIANTDVTDYQGIKAHVCEPRAMLLDSMDKIIGDTDKADNAINYIIAKNNNRTIDDSEKYVSIVDGKVEIERFSI